MVDGTGEQRTMTAFDVAERIKQEWMIKPTKKERVILAVETMALAFVLLSVAITMKLIGEMVKEYAISRYVKDKEADEYWNQHSRTVHTITDDNTVQ